MVIDQATIQRYLYEHVAPTAWQIEYPQRGFTYGTRYIGISAKQKVFVKLGEDYRILQSVSDAGLTPRYLAGGYLGESWITVQEWVEGWHPNHTWFTANIQTWAALMKHLHSLVELRQYLAPVADERYQSLLAVYIEKIIEFVGTLTFNADTHQQIQNLLEQYATRLPLIEGSGLVPTHGDPNRDNLLITPGQVYLLDWGSIHLSDPIRDVAQVLWWQYPRDAWPAMCEQFGLDLEDPQQAERFYLYISTRALDVSLFFHKINEDYWAQRFLKDAHAALTSREPGPLLSS